MFGRIATRWVLPVLAGVVMDRVISRYHLDDKVADGAKWVWGKVKGVTTLKRRK
jgi:hypothetical protein